MSTAPYRCQAQVVDFIIKKDVYNDMGKGLLFLSENNPNIALKRWYQKRISDLNESATILEDAGRVVRRDPALKNTLDVAKVYEKGPDWVLRDFYPDSLHLKDALDNPKAASALERTRNGLAGNQHPALLDLAKRLNRPKPSANFHWSPANEKIIWIDGL
ncbi:hypothetical protein F2P44_22680 [Massilia sp. CCM 8695]|uniref:Uncharacterized protein n=2 Tax=Massilia frigida TaxID=2609281 RepID=A0ABX0NFI4_9BURK|nr:hypothetical protein [Massilia frigida]